MWSKLTGAIKARPGTPSLSPMEPEEQGNLEVLNSVLEQHPNMSVFHQSEEVPFPSPSPPPSPSKRRGIFKRMSKLPNLSNDDVNAVSSTPSIRIPGLKKVKSSLHSMSTGSETSLHRPSIDTVGRPSEDDTARPSTDGNWPPITPITPIMETKQEFRFGSIRSILKSNNTPGTGQSVRFFSRDAYKVISPDNSTSTEAEDPSIFNRLRRAAPARPSAQEMFAGADGAAPPTPISPTGPASLMLPMSPPSLSNIFDLSQDAEFPTIPAGVEGPLLDSAIEVSEAEDGATASAQEDIAVRSEPERPTTPLRNPVFRAPEPRHSVHDRSHSFSFGQSVFHSMAAAESSPASDGSKAEGKHHVANRNRALSETAFQSLIHSPASALADTKLPETYINDPSTAVVVYASPSSPEKEKDPFGAYATTYYTPGTMMPPSPPQSNHTRTASKEEDIIWSLRTQLALQSELCAQYEVDLSARDQLVQMLNTKLTDVEKECERRKNIVRNWRKRVADLEKCIRGLEDEVERSREETVERSVMDEASGEALRMLHRRINELEREKVEVGKGEQGLREELEGKARELESVKAELEKRNLAERELKAGIKAAREEMLLMGQQTGQSNEVERDRRQSTQSAWEEERAQLVSTNDALHKEQVELQTLVTSLREEVVRKEEQMTVLKAEVEAQWKHTEKSGEDMESLKQEKDTLKGEIDVLNERISEMEMEWNENENRRVELEDEVQVAWSAKEELEKEREVLEDQIRSEEEHARQLTQALQERELRVTQLEQERQYALDNAKRLEENIRQRDAEIADYSKRVMKREAEVEDIREAMNKAKREHARTVDEQSRTLSDVVGREVEARANMETMVREKAESDIHLATLKERVTALKDEVERLRRQVHELQQESADKEVKLTQAAKQRAKDKEDMQGLNIALDSKQQELELLKRRIGVRGSIGTAASTPTAAAKAAPRRESSIFGTPSAISRPPSAMSDAGSSSKERKLSDPPSMVKPTFGRSVRANGPVGAGAKRVEGSMGPPPTKMRSSLVPTPSGTPVRTPTAGSSLARPSSATPIARVTHRRGSSSLGSSRLKPTGSSHESLRSSESVLSEQDEKENIDSTPSTSAQRSAIPVPA